MKFWVDGGLVDAGSAAVTVLDHGFTVGDGVFETLKVVSDPAEGPVPFALDRHVARLQRSAEGMGIDGLDPMQARAAMLAVCAANPELAGGGRVRLTLTSGPGPLGSDRSPGGPTLVVVGSAAAGWPTSTALALSPWPRNERSPLTGLKSTSYAENVLALARAKSHGAGEALLANLAGDVCEGTGSNTFFVFDGTVTTPPLSSGCLAGITRELVLEWCAAAGVATEERRVGIDEITLADEVFITSSTRDVHPVHTTYDDAGTPLWTGNERPMTTQVATIFAAREKEQWNP